uniref:LOB domain-containing protein n=1 Tax=Solanum lycopersicum TaxID=4081 RepID=A0A3Q7EMT8_SOLLC
MDERSSDGADRRKGPGKHVSGAVEQQASGVLPASTAPCGACKFLRRKCINGCVFAPYFGSDQGAARFAAVHKVFGASNVSKLLLHIPANRRQDAVVTITYEAQARLSDPVFGCVSTILALQQQVASLQSELAIVQTQVMNSRYAMANAYHNISQEQHIAILQPIPSALFVIYLASQAKRSFSKVSNGRSHVVAVLYAILWLVSIFNLAWCSIQAWECAPGKQFMWSVISLFTTSGMLFLEVSLIAFLLQGNHASGREALTQTFLISAIVVGLDISLKGLVQCGKIEKLLGKRKSGHRKGCANVDDTGILNGKGRGNRGIDPCYLFSQGLYLFGFGIQLFDVSNNGSQWALWVIHKLLLTGVYGLIFFMYRSTWRERLPARPAFQNYISIMFCVNATALLACALAAHGTGFGIWLYNITVICYHAMYLPLLYITFLADFLQEDDLHLENVYYSEMKDAGFFDVDWE